MSSNVASSSISVSVILSFDLPTVEEVKRFNEEKLNGFLKRKLNRYYHHFERWGIPGGPSKRIGKLDIQGRILTFNEVNHLFLHLFGIIQIPFKSNLLDDWRATMFLRKQIHINLFALKRHEKQFTEFEMLFNEEDVRTVFVVDINQVLNNILPDHKFPRSKETYLITSLFFH
ncbi:hypothetical protein RCL_jg3812.t1 [Rhizophagus clarus]|uniref:Uncharacterized protein n=1 Tax=Rhizophagus clarus TaxID=94130 RepID=A0A8H3KP77_9GLOM|nr:hypothetical protein RCL_jg3812.t1 [Rhizophagus clarus]